jgi:hypothetical protein
MDTSLEDQRHVEADPRENVFVLPPSFAQQRLWFIDQLRPHSAAYNLPAAVRILGELNAEALERSLNNIVGRYETLRTTMFTCVRFCHSLAIKPPDTGRFSRWPVV